MIDQPRIYLAYLLDEEAKHAEDPSSAHFLKLLAKYIRNEAGVTGMTTTFMHPGYRVTEVSLIETHN